MECKKSGSCDPSQNGLLCNGYVCQNGTVKASLQNVGDKCVRDSQCKSETCAKPDCSAMANMGVSSQTCQQMGVCVLKHDSIFTKEDY